MVLVTMGSINLDIFQFDIFFSNIILDVIKQYPTGDNSSSDEEKKKITDFLKKKFKK